MDPSESYEWAKIQAKVHAKAGVHSTRGLNYVGYCEGYKESVQGQKDLQPIPPPTLLHTPLPEVKPIISPSPIKGPLDKF